MKPITSSLIVLLLSCSFMPAQAQGRPGGLPGAGPGAQGFSAAFSKLFGDNKAFSATVTTEMAQGSGNGPMTMPAKMAYADGKSRMEVDMTQSKGPQFTPAMTEQMKAMGMAEMITISDEAKGVAYLIYPGLKAYAELSTPDKKPVDQSKIKVDSTELGKETIAGHPCVKNKVVITDQDGKTQDLTVWNATDLKKFPVRIDVAEGGTKATVTFSDIKFDKIDAKLFEPPADFKHYDNLQTMMQETMMQRMPGGMNPGK